MKVSERRFAVDKRRCKELKNLCTRCLVKARLGGWCDGELPAEHLSKQSWLELAELAVSRWWMEKSWGETVRRSRRGSSGAAQQRKQYSDRIFLSLSVLSPRSSITRVPQFWHWYFGFHTIRWGVCPEIHNILLLVETICVPCSSSCGAFKHLFVCEAHL